MAAGCTCAGKHNNHGEGSECNLYSGYQNAWYNGRWCYASVDTCPDAKAHPSTHVPGYGASKAACDTGKYIYICIYILVENLRSKFSLLLTCYFNIYHWLRLFN